MRQPDGAAIHVKIWGDEHYTRVESLDGYALVRDPASRSICYAALDGAGARLVSTGVRAGGPPPAGLRPHLRESSAVIRERAAAHRAQLDVAEAAAAIELRAIGGVTRGVLQGLCLLVDFPDDEGVIAPADIGPFLNQPGYAGYGNNGSVYDYYFDVSGGLLQFNNTVPLVYFRTSHPKAYYTDPAVPFGLRAREIIIEALVALSHTDFDFDTLDANKDGLIDGVSCLYAGWRESAWGAGLWPHSWTVNFSIDGVRTTRYQISDLRDGPRLSTFCHESAHMLFGWPDLYDTGFESYGVGAYCLMTGQVAYTSDGNPQRPCAYLRDLAGWTQTQVIDRAAANLVVPVGSAVYKLPHPSEPNEYYLVENRQQAGRDAGLPAGGLAIWHIDTLGNNANEQQTPQQHYAVTLAQADGRWDLEHAINFGDATDLWAAPRFTSFTPGTHPPLTWWNGAATDFSIYNISRTGDAMAFSVAAGDDCDENELDDSAEIDADPALDCNTNGLLDACEGAGLDCNDNGRIDACDIRAGDSADCNGNVEPDECEFPTGDCDTDGVLDDCAIAAGQVVDCDGNGKPDSCDLADGAQPDCNANGIPDVCDIATTWSADCDTNGVPDECEIATHDCNANGIHDACEVADQSAADCNANGRPDSCDLAEGPSRDCNGNEEPDECELTGRDCNVDGMLDVCQTIGNGDFNADGLSDCRDILGLISCWSGPAAITLPGDGCRSLCVSTFDRNADARLDLRDFAGWQRVWGPSIGLDVPAVIIDREINR